MVGIGLTILYVRVCLFVFALDPLAQWFCLPASPPHLLSMLQFLADCQPHHRLHFSDFGVAQIHMAALHEYLGFSCFHGYLDWLHHLPCLQCHPRSAAFKNLVPFDPTTHDPHGQYLRPHHSSVNAFVNF